MAITFKGGKPESKTFTLLPRGEYQFTVTECKQDTTLKGDDCLKIKIRHDSEEGAVTLSETLVFSDKAIWKFLQFVAACGQDPESGNFDNDDAINRTIRARVSVEDEDKAKGYPARNRVESFIFETGDEI